MNNDTADAIMQEGAELHADRLHELRREMELRFGGEFVENAVNRLDAASNFLRLSARITSLAAQDWRKHTALLQVKAFVDEMIEGQYNCSPHQYFMAAQGRAIDLKPVIDAAVATDPAPSLAAQDGLVDALRKALNLAVMTLAFIGRDQGTTRIEATLDGLCELAKEADPIIRAALASIEVKS